MGNYRFKLSDMIPNAWFYKLRDNMPRTTRMTTQNPNKKLINPFSIPPHKPRNDSINNLHHTSPSKILTSTFDPPRKSSKKKPGKRRTVYVPSQSKISPSTLPGDCNVFQLEPVYKPAGVHYQAGFLSPDYAPILDPASLDDFRALSGFQDTEDTDCLDAPDPGCTLITSSETDIIIDVKESSKPSKLVEPHFNMVPDPKLPPILTKPKPQNSLENENRNQLFPEFKKTALGEPKKSATPPGARRSFSRSGGGVRIRAKKTETRARARGRKSMKGEGKEEEFSAQRLAIVKASFDPERDFRESMMEMIVENNIRASKELEGLLASYLSLNSNQYHDIIIKAFEQTWFTLSTDPPSPLINDQPL